MGDEREGPSEPRSAPGRWVLRTVTTVIGRRGAKSERVERTLLVVAACVFVGATIIAWSNLPAAALEIRPSWIILAFLLTLIGLAASSVEFSLSASLLGHRIGLGEALRVTVVGSAANLLPVPGAVLVRMRSLRQAGEGTTKALIVTGAMGVAWLGAAAGLASVVLLLLDGPLVMGLLCSFATLVSAGVLFLLVRMAGGELGPGAVSWIAVVEVVKVSASSARLYAVAQLAGFSVGFMEAVAINLGAILSHAAGIVPGGLGIRELASGAFGHLVGVSASVAVLISVFDRVLVYILLGIGVILMLLTSRTKPTIGIREP